MFKLSDQSLAYGKPSSGPGTVIGANVKLLGAINDVNDITVHGKVEGEVNSEKTVTIGETAEIKGPVSGAIVTVAGLIRGSIEAIDRLEILPTGKVYGNIATGDLIIRSGAKFVGKSAVLKNDAGKNETKDSMGEETNKLSDSEESSAVYETESK